MVETVLTTSKSQELFERAKKIISGGVNSPVRAFDPHPFFVTRAKGSRIYGADGESYLDYCMAYSTMMLGHANPEVVNAVGKQLWKGTLYGAPTELEVDLAEQIRKLFPSMEMLRLVNTGTGSYYACNQGCKGLHRQEKTVKFEGCFHGSHDNVLVKAWSGAATFGTPNSAGIPEETTQNTIVLPYNNVEALEEAVMRSGHEIAAVIVEPVIGNAGLILPESDYLGYMRKLTKKQGIVLIFDEIIRGFRLALGGAQEYYNVKPDMTTLGKMLGGGFPIAAFGGKKK